MDQETKQEPETEQEPKQSDWYPAEKAILQWGESAVKWYAYRVFPNGLLEWLMALLEEKRIPLGALRIILWIRDMTYQDDAGGRVRLPLASDTRVAKHLYPTDTRAVRRVRDWRRALVRNGLLSVRKLVRCDESVSEVWDPSPIADLWNRTRTDWREEPKRKEVKVQAGPTVTAVTATPSVTTAERAERAERADRPVRRW